MLLFDTSPEEPTKKRGRKAKAAPPRPEAPQPAATSAPAAARPPIGVLDGEVACVDERCQAMCHDILDEVTGEWVLECCLCGTGQRIRVIRGHLPPPAEGADFVFRGGKFDGRSIGEVVGLEHGMEYLEWAAEEHPRLVVKKACGTYLASLATTR